MLLHPERYTDEQIEKMLNETPVAEPDVDEAWKHFKKGHHQYRQPMRWAAILITVAALSGISYAAIHHFQKTREEKQVTGVMPQQKPLAREVVWKKESKSVTSTLEEPDSTRHDQHFNNVPLQQIMQQISKDYGVDVDVRCLSAHRAHAGLSAFIDEANSNGTEVIIAAAGMAAALPGVVASQTSPYFIPVACDVGY